MRMKAKIAPQAAALVHAVNEAGGQSALARKLGIAPAAINRWVRQGRVPPLRVLAVEAATGVSRKALRPDIYP
jgi:DNA-binding transcriptional regulator YdaS (Cro superfamily)